MHPSTLGDPARRIEGRRGVGNLAATAKDHVPSSHVAGVHDAADPSPEARVGGQLPHGAAGVQEPGREALVGARDNNALALTHGS